MAIKDDIAKTRELAQSFQVQVQAAQMPGAQTLPVAAHEQGRPCAVPHHRSAGGAQELRHPGFGGVGDEPRRLVVEVPGVAGAVASPGDLGHGGAVFGASHPGGVGLEEAHHGAEIDGPPPAPALPPGRRAEPGPRTVRTAAWSPGEAGRGPPPRCPARGPPPTVIAGQDNTETASTGITNTSSSPNADGLVVQGGDGGHGMVGHGGTLGVGLLGYGGQPGGQGVYGFGGSPDGAGVQGTGGAAGGRGLIGIGGGTGSGVLAIGGETGSGLTSTGGPSGGTGVVALGGGAGVGVQAQGGDTNADGVVGQGGGTFGRGVVGLGGSSNGVGVQGIGGGTGPGVRGDGASGDGVFGVASSGTSSGVHGFCTSPSGSGVLAENSGGGTALTVSGPSVFSRSGTVAIASPAKSVTVTGVSLTPSSLVLATVQNSVGVWVASAVPNVPGSSFKINLNKAPATGKTATVAWFVVN